MLLLGMVTKSGLVETIGKDRVSEFHLGGVLIHRMRMTMDYQPLDVMREIRRLAPQYNSLAVAMSLWSERRIEYGQYQLIVSNETGYGWEAHIDDREEFGPYGHGLWPIEALIHLLNEIQDKEADGETI
jgi:hypothetical protein